MSPTPFRVHHDGERWVVQEWEPQPLRDDEAPATGYQVIARVDTWAEAIQTVATEWYLEGWDERNARLGSSQPDAPPPMVLTDL